MSKVFKGFALALSMLSTLPFFKVHDFYKGINGYAVIIFALWVVLTGALHLDGFTIEVTELLLLNLIILGLA